MAEIIPYLKLDVGWLVLLQPGPPFFCQGFFRWCIFGRISTLVSQIDLLVTKNLSSSNHDEKRRQTAQGGLHDRANQRMGQEFIRSIHLSIQVSFQSFKSRLTTYLNLVLKLDQFTVDGD
jgi:hypothetical protein